MIVTDVIEALKKMPPNAEVFHIWDGAARTRIEYVWLCNDGSVATVDHGMVVYRDRDRPAHAPTEKEEGRWESPENPNEYEDEE